MEERGAHEKEKEELEYEILGEIIEEMKKTRKDFLIEENADVLQGEMSMQEKRQALVRKKNTAKNDLDVLMLQEIINEKLGERKATMK